jgi:DNA-binding CsgD family transcriptional regulator
VEAANAAWSGGDTLRARDLVAEVLAARPPEAVRTQALQLAARMELLEGRMSRARALYRESAALAGPSDPLTTIRALGFVVYACMNEGRIAEAVETGRNALALAHSSGDAALMLQSEYLLGRSLLLAGETDEGGRLLFDVVDRIEAGEPGRLEVTRVAVALVVLGQPERAIDRALRAVELARQEGPMVLVQALAVQTAIAVRAGEWRTAVAACAEGLELARQLGQENPASSVLNDLAFVQAVRGEEESCRDTAAAALEGFERSGAAAERERLRCTLGLLELGRDRLAEAITHLEEASDAVDAMGLCDRDVSPEPDLVEALVRAGSGDEGPRYLERWLDRGAAGTFWGPPLAARCSGLLGDGDSFEAAFEQALVAHEALRDPFQLARTQLAYGQRLRREGRRVDSREQLRRALETFEHLEAEPWAERTRQELRASGAKLRRAAEPGDELTPQELQIALQVAEGKANKEVAAAMFLSTKTVEFHLSRIYRKLGLASRSELVRRYAAELTVAAS